MRILHIITRAEGGSLKNVLSGIRIELESGHDVWLVGGSERPAANLPLKLGYVRIPSLRRSFGVGDMVAVWQLFRLIRRLKVDVVHTHQSKAGVVGRLAASAAGVGFVIHTIHMAPFGPGYRSFENWVFRRVERVCAKLTDRIVSVGVELAEMFLSSGIGRPEQFRVVRSPIDVDAFAAVRDIRGARASDMASRRVTFVTIGALEARKRVALLIDRLRPRLLTGDRLLVAGDGCARSDLEDLVRISGLEEQVTFLGYVRDVPLLLSEVDVYVHASAAEGVPQVILQAMIAGVPVVATMVEGLAEVSGGGICIADRDGDDLLEMIERCLEAARPLPLTVFDEWRPEVVAARYRSLFEEAESSVLSKRQRSRHQL